MKYRSTILLLTLCVAISACDVADTTMENGAISLKDNAVTLHVKSAPDAVIDATGSLQIGDKLLSISPPQRGLLMLYYQNVRDVYETGKQMATVGTGMGANAIKNKLNSKSDADQQKDAEAGEQQLNQLSLKICQDEANIKTVQDQLAAQLAAFKPYSTIVGNESVARCQKDSKS